MQEDKHPFLVLLSIPSYIIYYLWRTLYLLKVLLPAWGRYMLHDARVAKQVYSGQNIRFIYLPENKVNKYHTRYEGTDRAADNVAD